VVREVLLEILWPKLKQEQAVGSLDTLVYDLRPLLTNAAPQEGPGAKAILHENGRYALNVEAGVAVDFRLFEAPVTGGACEDRQGDTEAAISSLGKAIGLYRGVLSSLIDMDDAQRERLRLTYLRALGRLAEHYYTLGDYATCADAVRIFHHKTTASDVSAVPARRGAIFFTTNFDYYGVV
jgi:DNA-binding SARP family transcriptional activator